MKRVFSQVFKPVFNSACAFFFPSFCLSCKCALYDDKTPLCKECFSLLELLDPIGRCPICFSEFEQSRHCQKCHKKKSASYVSATCFDPSGPIGPLAQSFCNKDMTYLSSALGAFLLLQIDNLSWSYPDVVTYVPQTFFESATSWYNPSKLLAQKLAKMMKLPFDSLVKKEFQVLETPYFRLKAKDISKKKILLVDGIKTHETLSCCESFTCSDKDSLHVLTLY